jgi:hypothetical protein
VAIEWIDRPRGTTPVDAWTYRADLGSGWEIYGNIEPFSASGLFGWVVLWRPDEFRATNDDAVHVELRMEGFCNLPWQAKAEAAQAIGRLQTMANADPQMLIRLQTTTGGV